MLTLKGPPAIIDGSISLSGSKSITNRIFILNAVLGNKFSFTNPSDSEDSRLLKSALTQIQQSKESMIDVRHAGTDFRFLTAYLATVPGSWQLTGSPRLKERPIGELVDALQILGADISYENKTGYPPLRITGKKLQGGKTQIDASVSSQFLSALILIAPSFDSGLTLGLKGKLVSKPYLNMTIDLLRSCGFQIDATANEIKVHPQQKEITARHIAIESDWSSASYYYSICALAPGSSITITGLNRSSEQADSVLPELYKSFVHTEFKDGSARLTNKKNNTTFFNYDFTDCPDIAQTMAVTCFGLGVEATLTGLGTLKHKETDRIKALKTELENLGAEVSADEEKLSFKKRSAGLTNASYHIETYEDHRMAMSFAPLCLLDCQLHFSDPAVVDKSYPKFWKDLISLGFSVNLQP